MLKTTKSFKLSPKIFNVNKNEIFRGGNGEVDKITKNSFKAKKSKNTKFKILTQFSNIKAMKKPIFLILSIKKTLNHLKQAFIKAPIF